MIRLVKVSKRNSHKLGMIRLKGDQVDFVSSASSSYRSYKSDPSKAHYLVYDNRKPIGYVMYGVEVDDGKYWLYRFIIDRDCQGKGYGTSVLKKVIDLVPSKELRSTYLRGNLVMRRLFLKVGFKVTKQRFGREIGVKLTK